jgi:hypothetical protein
MKKPTVHKLHITTNLFYYLADCFWEDITRIVRYELGDEWYNNDDACPSDQLCVMTDALQKYIRREFPKKTVKYYEEEQQRFLSDLMDDD